MSLDTAIKEFNDLWSDLEKSNLSTSDLLRLLPFFRLDWGEDENEFSDDYGIGDTKPVLLSGLASNKNKIKSNSVLFENSEIAKVLVTTFISEKKLSKEFLLHIHRLLIADGGRWRGEEVTVKDFDRMITPPFVTVDQIESQIDDLIRWFNLLDFKKEHPLSVSAIFHYRITKIHPFIDGNGRLARMFTSMILLSYSIPPPIFKKADRFEYITSLRNADTGDIKPLIVFIGNKVSDSIKLILSLKNSSNV